MDSSSYNTHYNSYVNWPLGLSHEDNMKKTITTIGVSDITEEHYNHYFHKWLYTYGGASDVKTISEFIYEYDSDVYGDIDKYDTGLCPCVMCMEESI